MDNKKIIKLLKRLPEVKLGLIDMLWNIVDEKGRIVPDKILFHQKELELFIQEAQEYVNATREAVHCLKHLAKEES